MRELLLMPSALGDLGWWVQHDVKILKKFISFLKTLANPRLKDWVSPNL
jgi:hypothetical protein